ncbi:perlwapin-like [Mytilus trossulus]|uniref:perlwapin-like n=1 Tax=Mytilus trossulus TaxID=6551 RepID=UPI003003EC9B
MWQVRILILCIIHSVHCAPDRPGCPKCTSHKATPACPVCVMYRHQCNSDKECKRGQICCLNPQCGRSCREPERITKPGVCPINTRPDQMCAAFVFNCVHDGRCPGNQKCCVQGCYLSCVEPVNSRYYKHKLG